MLRNLPDDLVPPNYVDGSIANVPATVARWLGVQFRGLQPLAAHLLPGDVISRPKRVVLIIIDGLGWSLVPMLLREMPGLFTRAGVVARLTSVFPSTTVAALSSLWTGLAPAQHGLVGLRLFFPEWGALGQMIKLSPEFVPGPDALVNAGLQPDRFLYGPGLAEQLATGGVTTYSFKHEGLANTALSQMHSRGVAHEMGIYTAADMFVQMRQLLLQPDDRPLFVSAYWPTVDSVMHRQGPNAESVQAEARMIIDLIDRELLTPLEEAGRGDTLVCIVADHGQIATPVTQQVAMRDHPEMAAMLMMRPAGEPRVPYLYARHGAEGELLAYICERLPKEMAALSAPEALDRGLFGPLPYAPETISRVGDVVAIMREGYVLLTDDEPGYLKRMAGRHGSLTPEEMFVPWLVFRV